MTMVNSDPAQLDAAWMTGALEHAGVARGAAVTAVEFAGYIGTGQTGRNGRFHLTWDDPAGRPSSVVAKFPSGDPVARANAFENGTYVTEYAFYEKVAHTVDIRVPEMFVAHFDETVKDFVFVMEDLSGSRQGDQIVGLTPEEAALAVEQAVGLHAPRWGDPTLPDFVTHRASGEERAIQLATMYGMCTEPFLDRLGSRLDPDVVDLVRAIGPHFVPWLIAVSETPSTMIHLDFRPDNFLFGVEDGAPPLVVVDWQTAADGNAMMDLGYMIGGSFEPAQRAAVEADLLRDYVARMNGRGVDYGWDVAWRDYRLGALWGVVMTVIATILAAETERGNDMLTVMAQRHGRHSLDLDTLGLLGG
ncbi:MAG: phosphotransferase [Ilumatobacteraceae bacterium]